tara:strand:+ start:957 stop:1556 length:600 start_codon:yes stop_codon:yes gene_type:complete
MAKVFATKPGDFVDENSSEPMMGSYKWCVENGGCEKAMCVIMNASLRDNMTVENLTEGIEQQGGDYELVECDTVPGFSSTDWVNQNKIRFFTDSESMFKLTQLGYLTTMQEGVDVVPCYKPADFCNDGFDPGKTVNVIKAKCYDGIENYVGYQCNRDDGAKSFYSCEYGHITANAYGGFLDGNEWREKWGDPATNCVAL